MPAKAVGQTTPLTLVTKPAGPLVRVTVAFVKGSPESTTIDRDSVDVVPNRSDTRIPKATPPETVGAAGVPEITPVDESSASALGSVPEVIDHV